MKGKKNNKEKNTSRSFAFPEFLRRIKWDRQLISLAGMTAAVLIICAAVPMAFITETGDNPPAESPDVELTHYELWSAYWSAYREGLSLADPIENPDKFDVNACQILTHELRLKLAPDMSPGTVTGEGEEFLCVDGRLKLYHCWNEWTGDWRNWLDIFIDLDTQEVLYFYLSSSCIANIDRYTDLLQTELDTEAGAKQWGNAIDLEMTNCTWSGDPEDYADVEYGDVRYRVSTKYYFDPGYPSGLLDLMAVRVP
ncbi:MAG: hypothetical protein Q4A39_06070 [Eubacteriales bacterium]|nr:hypothetical protein [Eubacteriales bacterium]